MKNLWISFLMVIITNPIWAQVKISGCVKDKRGRALKSASISIKDSYDGTLADSAGHFSFVTYEKGQQVAIIKFLNYKTLEIPINVAKDTINLNVVLREEINELQAVTVTAGSFEASDRKKASTVLTPIDMYTTAGSNGDITSALKTLPGAQQVGDQEGLFVRGGAGYETKQIIDGTVVNNPFFASVPDIAQRGRFSPSLFKGNVFSTGGYSAQYGEALSSVLLLESIDLPEKTEATASITSVFVGSGMQKVAKNKKSSFGINYGYTNLALYYSLVKQNPDYFFLPQIHAVDANLRIKTHKGIIKYYTTFGANELGLRRENIDSALLKNAFHLRNTDWYNNLSWRENLGNGWKMNLGLSYSTDFTKIDQTLQNQSNQPITTGLSWIDTINYNLHTRSDLTQFRAVFDKRLGGISTLHLGGEYWYSYNNSMYNNYTYIINNTLLTDHLKSAFAESDIYLSNDLAAKIGVRAEHSTQLRKANIAPRISLAYKTGQDAQVSAAYGEFYQKPENSYVSTAIHVAGPVDWGYVKATHYIINYIHSPKDITFRVEAYYKKYNALVTTSPAFGNLGSGYAQGIEFFYRDKKTIKNLDYWISYSYLDTKRQFLNYPQKLAPTFAASHTLSLVGKRFVEKIHTGFNFTYTFATGRPYYNIEYNPNTFKNEILDQGKTAAYSTIGLSCNYLTKMGKAFAVCVASVSNVLGTDLVYGYNYAHNGNKEAVGPTAPRFVFLGLFLSWGVDRSQDAINNNL